MSGEAVGARVVYEVNVDVDAAIEHDYRRWLTAHVAEILALPGFIEAAVFDVADPPAPAGRFHLCMQYTLHDAAALQDYLDQHAQRLRNDGLERFGGRFVATRRVLRR